MCQGRKCICKILQAVFFGWTKQTVVSMMAALGTLVMVWIALGNITLTKAAATRTEKLFALQNRPLLHVDTLRVIDIDPRGDVALELYVSNYGRGGATNVRVEPRVGSTALGSMWLGRNAFGSCVDTIDIPPGAGAHVRRLCPGAMAGFTMKDTYYIHTCCDFTGLETGIRYYYENVVMVDSIQPLAPGGSNYSFLRANVRDYHGFIWQDGIVREKSEDAGEAVETKARR